MEIHKTIPNKCIADTAHAMAEHGEITVLRAMARILATRQPGEDLERARRLITVIDAAVYTEAATEVLQHMSSEITDQVKTMDKSGVADYETRVYWRQVAGCGRDALAMRTGQD